MGIQGAASKLKPIGGGGAAGLDGAQRPGPGCVRTQAHGAPADPDPQPQGPPRRAALDKLKTVSSLGRLGRRRSLPSLRPARTGRRSMAQCGPREGLESRNSSVKENIWVEAQPEFDQSEPFAPPTRAAPRSFAELGDGAAPDLGARFLSMAKPSSRRAFGPRLRRLRPRQGFVHRHVAPPGDRWGRPAHRHRELSEATQRS